eukprot:scaffold152_cov383-Prasinococcus_capsulatus_cf.AAC.4
MRGRIQSGACRNAQTQAAPASTRNKGRWATASSTSCTTLVYWQSAPTLTLSTSTSLRRGASSCTILNAAQHKTRHVQVSERVPHVQHAHLAWQRAPVESHDVQAVVDVHAGASHRRSERRAQKGSRVAHFLRPARTARAGQRELAAQYGLMLAGGHT